MHRKWLALTLSLLLMPTLWACSDDTEGDPQKDSGIPDKAIMDQKVATPDKKLEDQAIVDQAAVDQAMVDQTMVDQAMVDIGTDGVTTPDMAAAEGGVIYKDGAGLDAVISKDSGPPPSCKLKVKQTLTMTNGKAQVGGEILKSDAVSQVQMSSAACTGTTTPGADHLYAVKLKAGTKYTVYLAHNTGYNAAFYVFSNCAKVIASCELGQQANSGSYGYETGTFTAKFSGTYYIGVDTYYKVGESTFGWGTYKLGIMESTMTPANDTCAKAQVINFLPGSDRIWQVSDTTNAKDDSSLTSAGCTKNPSAGPDLFYKLAVTAGAQYTVTLTGKHNVSLYLFTDCAKIASTCGAGMGGDSSTSGSEEVSFTAKTSGTYIIAVDGRALTDKGPFGLEIDRVTKPTNDTCATATKLPLTSGKVSIKGNNVLATNTLNLTKVASCTGKKVKGGDMFYSLTTKANQEYQITLTPGAGFDGAVAVLSKCDATGAACVAGADSATTANAEKLTFKATGTGPYKIVVSSSILQGSTGSGGPFSLKVAEYTTPAGETCKKPAALTFTSGTATATGNTTNFANDLNMSGSSCGGSTSGASGGNDVFYKVTLKANQKYTVTLTPAASFDAMVYAFSDCAKPTTSCLGVDDPIGTGKVGTISFTPATAGTYFIGVDGWSSSFKGKYTLTVK